MAPRLSFQIIFLLVSLLFFSCNPKKKTVPQDFQIEPGFTLTLVASEPLIKDPVDFEFNEDGDAFVLEMPGYPFEDTQSRVVLLKDENEDGLYDRQIIFSENLQLATSIMPYKKGLLVAAPPYLLFVKDSDGDYKTDVTDTLMGGFSTGNLQHNYNGLTYGIDNWIYAANGGNSGKPYWWGDTTSVIDLRGQDLRFNLDTKVMERIGRSSGGFGLGVDEWGHLFETHNLEHVSHLVFPGRYQQGVTLLQSHSLSNISDHEEDGLARIYPIGEQESRVNHPEQSGYFSGSCGITWYGSGAMGKEYENTIWVADVVLNLIHVDKVKPNGASLTATRMLEKRDFLASKDRSFRPVNLMTGPDGAIYVVDMYREVIEHPEWIPDEIEATLNLNSGKDKGRIYKIQKEDSEVPAYNSGNLKSVEGAIAGLSNPNQWIRKTAHRLLMEQTLSDAEMMSVAQLLKSESELVRLHALWILSAKDQLSSEQLLNALNDTSAGIRENVLVMSEKYIRTHEAVFQKILSLTGDEHQRVRMQAALSISTLGNDVFTRYQDTILDALAQSVAKPIDDWNIAALTLASRPSPAQLFDRIIVMKDAGKNEKLLSSLALVSGGTIQHISAVMKSLADATLNNNSRQVILDQLNKGVRNEFDGASVLPSIRQMEKSGDIGLVSTLASLRQKLKLPSSPEFLAFSKEALKILSDRSKDDTIRFQQFSLIEFLPYEQKADVLFSCLGNTEPMNIQEAALRQLGNYPKPEVGVRLVIQWPELGPQTRRYASDILIYKKIHHNALLTGLEKGMINIGEMNFDLERRRQLLIRTDNEDTKRRAAALFSDAGVTTRKDAIAKMQDALTLKGSLAKGATVFQSMCSSCHVYEAVGQHVGPVLTEINRKSKESLMHDILDPNAAVNTQYINHRLVTRTDEVHMGIVENETDQAVTIKKMGGASVTISKSDIKSFSSLGTSLMMEGLEGNMTTQDMADLLAFLQNGN